jgi:phage gp36-like protein
MPYSTINDLRGRISEPTLIQLADTANTGAADTALVQNAIADADALIDSMVAPVYRVPLSPVPRVITALSAAIAIYNLHLFRSVDPGVWKDAHRQAVEFLKTVAEGKSPLEGASVEPAPSANLANTLSFTAEPRNFSRTLLKDW